MKISISAAERSKSAKNNDGNKRALLEAQIEESFEKSLI